MDHAAAHERIEDLLLEPSLLASLPDSVVPEDMALREHVAGCPACRADLAAWRQVQVHVTEALPASRVPTTDLERMAPPADLRDRVIAGTRASTPASTAPAGTGPEGAVPDRETHRRWTRPAVAWLAAAAALVVVIGAGAFAVDQAAQRAAAEAEAAALNEVVASIDRILAVPEHKVVSLTGADGSAGGSMSWTRHDLVVLSTVLAPPASGSRYRCWLTEDGREMAIGDMDFAGSAAYWIGTLDEWATFQVGPDTRFIVSLEPSGATEAHREGQAVLEADLSS